MRRTPLFAIVLTCLLFAACKRDATAQPVPTAATSEARIEQLVRTLADDAMAGRYATAKTYSKATDAVVQPLQALGLRPAGDGGGWLQQVPLLQAVRAEDGQRLVIHHRDRDVTLQFKQQFLPDPDADLATADVDAPAVFVGYGVHAPALQHDDYAGIDMRGKVAVLVGGAPGSFDPIARAHHGRLQAKLVALAQRGAVAAVLLNSAMDEAQSPWAKQAANWNGPVLRLRDTNGRSIDGIAQLRAVVRVSATAADLVLDGSGETMASLAAKAQAGTLKPFALPTRVSLGARSVATPTASANVVARLPGSDPSLPPVILTAHLDHLGLAANGDVLNGALDNALGVAITVESLRLLSAQPARKRDVLFVATTAEEHGLLGAEWFVRSRGTLPAAALNLDMPILLAPSSDIVAVGGPLSSLGEIATRAAQAQGATVSPDPYPDDALFVRSDQYVFARRGVPALYLTGGQISVDGKRKPVMAQRKFMREHYHNVSDDASLPIAYGDAARLARITAGIVQAIAVDATPPRWLNTPPFAIAPR